eukprot:scaffold15108_cov180-Amphora_coffeaeformis.AAC.28
MQVQNCKEGIICSLCSWIHSSRRIISVAIMNSQNETAQFATDPLWDPSWKESYGEANIKERSQKTSEAAELTLYCSWFCPFGARVWAALEELGINYKYIEVNPYKVDHSLPGGYSKEGQTIQDKKKLLPEFVKVSPYGLVPVIVEPGGSIICDSSVGMEYLNQKYGNGKLFPKDPLAASLVRLLKDHMGRILSANIGLIQNPSEEERITSYHKLIDECRAIAIAMAPYGSIKVDPVDHPLVDLESLAAIAAQVHGQNGEPSGPFVLGATFSAADIVLGTIWIRVLWLGEHYRDLKFPDEPTFVRLAAWWKAVSTRQSFQKTMVCRERLLACDLTYARRGAGNDSGIAPLDYTKTNYPSLASSKKSKL